MWHIYIYTREDFAAWVYYSCCVAMFTMVQDKETKFMEWCMFHMATSNAKCSAIK